MRRYLCVLLLFSCLILRADFKAGLDAYQRKDFQTALKEWEPIAAKGDPNAQYNLGLLYARGEGVPQDYAKAAEWYRKAAEQGVAAAQYNLGVMYGNGQGVPKDAAEATKWFTKAAEAGVADAEVNLGNVYQESDGFKNPSEAEKWYRKAAERGVASAQFQIAVIYDVNEKNYPEAINWYKKAADQGYAGAYTNLGILYYNAQGVKRDLVEAYAWFSRAKAAGEPRADQLLKATAEKMKPKDIQKGQELAAAWHPGKQATQEADRAAQADILFAKAQTAPAQQAPAVAAPQQPAPAAVPQAPAQQSTWTGVERVVAVGDLHGDFEQFTAVLESAGLIDGSGNWIGGKAHLVQTGDIVDRGPDSRKIMDALMRLEEQAKAAGGYVHCLIGNHEAMDVYGDLRYVSPAEFASYRGLDSTSFSYANRQSDVEAKPDPNRANWGIERPGFAEHRAALGPAGKYGKWISSHDTVIRIDNTIFVHAGISPKYAAWNIDRINEAVRDELQHPEKLHGGVVTDEEGPLWYRGLAKGDEKALAPVVDQVLKNWDAKRIVIGHTYANAAITPRFAGKVVLIDIGLSRIYDNVGKLGCLVIENGRAYALHRGQKLELPKDEGPDMLRYLKEAAALDPKPSPLAARIGAMERQ